jgi:hypothetical protein
MFLSCRRDFVSATIHPQARSTKTTNSVAALTTDQRSVGMPHDICPVFGLSRSIWLSVVALAILGAADTVSVVIRVSLVQLATPDAMHGRVGAVNFLFIHASGQLGEFESGMTAALFGVMPATVLGGLGTIAVALLWMRLFRRCARSSDWNSASGRGPHRRCKFLRLPRQERRHLYRRQSRIRAGIGEYRAAGEIVHATNLVQGQAGKLTRYRRTRNSLAARQRTMFAASSASISAAAMPASSNTSRVCSPRAGAGRRISKS